MRSNKHIAVIGAGFSGLAAASKLASGGFSVTVLEARERLGGRVWSELLPNGAIVELGGEWISSADKTVLKMAKRFDLALVPLGVDFRIRAVANGPAVKPETQRETHRIASETLAAMEKATISNSTIGEFLNNLPLKPQPKALLQSRLQGSFGMDLQQIALRMLGDYSLGEGGTFYRLAKGNQSLARAMAAHLPDVRLGHAVTAITHRPNGASVRGEAAGTNFQIDVDALVIAIPVSQLTRLEFSPVLPKSTAEAFSMVPMGVAAKLAIGTQTAPSLRALQDVEMPYWCWTGNGEGDVPRSAVTAFCGSKKALSNLATDSYDPSIWREKIQSANRNLDFVGDPIMVDWSLDEWARGCYSAFDNRATELIPHLSNPVGRIFFAGEHTAAMSGTMEGALASGLRAAGQIGEVLRCQ